MPAVTVYTTPYCPYCHRAKMVLRGKGVAFEEIDVSDYDERRALEERTRWPTVPQVFIGEQFIGGCDELEALDACGELDDLLAA
jgi:glutaredoxin 3